MSRRAAALMSLAAASLCLLILSSADARAARIQCPGTFHVLHNDHVGNLSLPKGRYQIRILRSGTPSCAAASKLFTRFLQDFDGKLPFGYRVAAVQGAFVKSPGVGFAVRRNGGGGGGGGGGGRHPGRGHFCSGTFHVLHNDHIGALQLPRGRYWIVVKSGLTCARASSLFTRFLASPSGKLPSPWVLNAQIATFRRGSTGKIFRVKPVG